MNDGVMHKRFCVAGLLLLFGLITLLVTLMWEHPMAFLFSLGLAGGAIILGVAIYLHTVVTLRS